MTALFDTLHRQIPIYIFHARMQKSPESICFPGTQRVKKASQSLPPAGGKGILILDLQYKCNK